MRPGDSQGDGFGARERDLQDPLCLLLLILFLQGQEKNGNQTTRQMLIYLSLTVENPITLCYNNRTDILKEAFLCCLKPFWNE